ncbi:MAG: T9SS type A sorting domain-containing protein [Chitinophagales bacterium]|nr:T9SS type A sorting domain-containing protein [Chitinophagales bacterium]
MKPLQSLTCLRHVEGNMLHTLLLLLWCFSGFAQTINRNMMTTDGTVRTTIQDGNTIYLGGEFSHVGWPADRIARFKPGETRPDNSFPQLGGGPVYDIEPDGNGGYYTSGGTGYFNGNTVTSNILHMLNDNSLDTAFHVSVTGEVYGISKLDDKLYIAGSFSAVNGDPRTNLAAIDAATGATLPWIPDAPDQYLNLVRATPTTVFIQGSFSYVGNHYLPGNFAALDAVTGKVNTSFPVGDGAINTIESDGNQLYVGGTFNSIGTPVRGLAKMSTSSTNPVANFPQTDGSVYTMVQDGSGGNFIGGYFTHVGGEQHQYLAHILADGTVDPNFTASTNSTVWCMATDGTNLFIGGDFTAINGVTRNKAGAVLCSNGTLTNWDPNANSSVWAMALSGTNVYMGGGFTSMKGTARNYAAAVSSSGTGNLQSWSPSTNNYVYTLIMDGTGSNVYLGGSFTTVKGATHNYIAKVNSTNGNVNSWNPTVNNEVWTLLLNGTTLYMGGIFSQVGSSSRLYFAAITEGATQPTSLQVDANNAINIFSLAGNNLYVGGYFTELQGVSTNYLSRINLSTGLIDTTWKGNLSDAVSAISVNGSTVVAGGIFAYDHLISKNHLACFDLSNNQLTAWNPVPSFYSVSYIGKILHHGTDVFAGGYFYYYDSLYYDYYLISLDDQTGELSHSLHQYPDQPVTALAVADGKLVVGGYFNNFYDWNTSSYIPRKNLAAYDLSNFQLSDMDYAPNGFVYDMLGDDNDLIFAGDFTLMGSVTRNRIAAIDATSGIVTAFDPNANGNVNVLASSGSTVYAGGEFSNIGGQSRLYLAALNASDGTATSWNADCNSYVWAAAMSGTTLYVGGYFTSIKSQSRNYAAAVSTIGNGSVTNWQPNPNSTVEDILTIGSDVYLAGYFTTVKGSSRNYLAKVNNTNGNLNNWNPSPDSYCWSLAANASTLFVSGNFENISSQARSSIAAFDLASGTLTSLHPVILPAYQGVYDIALWGNTLFFSANTSTMNINGSDRGNIASIDITSSNLLDYDPQPKNGSAWCIQTGNNRLLAGGTWDLTYNSASTSPYFAASTLAPLTQSAALQFSNITPTSIQANFTAGTGERRIVVVKEGSGVNNLPMNGQSYNASAAFKTGSNLGNACYAVYDGTGSSVTVTDLLPNHAYYFAVLEYNGTSDYTAYLIPALTGSQAAPCNVITPVITPDGPTTFCNGGVTLSAPAGFASYLWSNGATTQSIFVSSSGSFSVTVTDVNACSGTSSPISTTAGAGPVSVITPAGATTFCDGSKVKLNANTGDGLTYQWELNTVDIAGATKKNYTAKTGGSYTLVVTANGCSTLSAPVVVTVNPSPISKITNNSPVNICQGQTVVLTAKTGDGYTYKWQLNGSNIGGATNSTYTASAAGSYTVKTTNPGGCNKISKECIVNITCKDGVDLFADQGMRVYPNPSQSNFTVSFYCDDNYEISVFDITGREVWKSGRVAQTGHVEFEVDGGTLLPGMYFVKVKRGEETEVQKIEIVK